MTSIRCSDLPQIRVTLVRDADPAMRTSIRGPQDVWNLLQAEASTWDREHLCSLLLDGRHRLIALEVVSVGTLTASLVHPREVFKAAILADSGAIVLAHNHPSGDPSPSSEDRSLTSRLRQVGELVGIPILDHVILGRHGYFSFTEDGSL